MESKTNVEVTEAFVGERLDSAVFKLVDAIPSRSFAAKLIDSSLVVVNGKPAKPSLRLKETDVLTVDLSALDTAAGTPPKGEKIPLEIMFEDEHIIVINKNAGMVVHPGAGVSSGTLVNAILSHCGSTLPSLGGPERAGIVHRLDRDTSGVMVVAKSQLALTRLSQQFASHAHDRRYRALVYLKPQPPEGEITTWHGRDPKNRLRYAVVEESKGKEAKLRYRTVTSYLDGLASEVECELHTGRTHQIRVQMLHIKCPLMGDALYGRPPDRLVRNKEIWAKLTKLLTRQMLHAASLGITHPATDARLSFQSEPPSDFAEVRAALQEFTGNPLTT